MQRMGSFFLLPVWLIFILIVYSAASLTYVFVNSLENTFFAYISYAVSAYMLSAVCVRLYKGVPKQYKRINEMLYSNSFGNKYLTDVVYRAKISLYVSVAINLVYSAFKFASGIYFRSYWWGSVAFYYIALSLTRFLLLRSIRKTERDRMSEWKRYRLCAFAMLVMNLALSGVVFMIVRRNSAFVYPEVIVITVAVYTFYAVISSITDMVRYRKHQNPLVSASKLISFASALVSLLNMETAMLARYGESGSFRNVMTASTGIAVCAAVLIISIYMIVRSNDELKKGASNNGKQ